MQDAISVYQSVRELMCVNELDQRLKLNPSLFNAFGRPLAETSARISHYVQSSAVDVSCHGFGWLLDQLDSDRAKPVYLIHDALVLDVRKDYLSTVENFCKDGLHVSIINQNLPVKMRRFGRE